ncbi:peptidoglycan-recognition protein LC-like isoform X3 [Haematobia irritans]|uniref:peptidoglycan-recognition protein LC-like isoform X3 n=1 Tax=Haematobia irritans TaxID=7368 RepID=UPI003F4F4359
MILLHRKMHLNHLLQPQQQEQHQQPNQNQQKESRYDFVQTSDKSSSLSSDGSSVKITNATQQPSHMAQIARSETNCTSSTDSGVHISDNENINITTSAPSSSQQTPQHQQPTKTSPFVSNTASKPQRHQFHPNNKGNHSNVFGDKNSSSYSINRESDWNDSNVLGYTSKGRNSSSSSNVDKKFAKIEKNFESGLDTSALQQNNRNVIESDNVMLHRYPAMAEERVTIGGVVGPGTNGRQRGSSPDPSSTVSSSSTDTLPNTHPPFHHHCNRSPAVSIRSIDSSVIDSDSDSDEAGDAEGVHKNYVIKKLGTQVSYPPKHPDIPTINKGLTVVNQQITPNQMGPMPPSPLAILTQLGDNLGMANSFAQAPVNRPQVAISSSTDVTIGDKHFYEGPVTIQQFLIDSRDKANELNGKDNVVFVDENGATCTNAKDINSSPTGSDAPHINFLRRKKFMIAGACAVIALIVVAIIFGMEAINDNKNTTSYDNLEDDGCVEGQLCLIERDIWRGRPQKNKLDPQKLPLHRVVIAHTASEPCDSLPTCRERVRVIQDYHMDSIHWDDIGYNFLISSDGRVYVGRGWDDVGAVVKGFNYDSVGIAFIGTFVKDKPTEAQLNACRLLLEEGVRLKKLVPDYILNGARQLSPTESPGEALYKIIRRWPHWTSQILL